MTFPSTAPQGALVWWPEFGMGYYPVTAGPGVYDAAYWQKYVEMDATLMGVLLTTARVEMVQRYWQGTVVDVGIGAGAFVQARQAVGRTLGWDVNPLGVAWLAERGLLQDPTQVTGRVALTFWDCLEHIPEPGPLLDLASWVFVSLPIFQGPDHVLRSRHYRQTEHCWYWTRQGFLNWMQRQGFECVDHNTQESLLGRQDIDSFAFKRVGPPHP